MEDMETISGQQAMQWAKELSKLPDGCFTIAFFPFSRKQGKASNVLNTLEGCRYRTQLPHDKFDIDSDNFFLFTNDKGEPKMCYKVLIRYMAFSLDNYKLHKVNWYE